ncbi:MAG: tetratricopeptide repeat protein [Gammaproteobacteria bacterium]|nr:MAG: tetratricopeptide repeat protein [Gammaproteobacteria bacterium]
MGYQGVFSAGPMIDDRKAVLCLIWNLNTLYLLSTALVVMDRTDSLSRYSKALTVWYSDTESSHVTQTHMIRKLLILLLSTVLLSGCTILRTKSGPDAAIKSEQAVSAPDDPLMAEMYHIMVAEIAGMRGALKISTAYYEKAVLNTANPDVAKRATKVAIFTRNYDRALKAAERWVSLAPDDMDARQSVAILYIRTGQLDRALPALEYVVRKAKGGVKQGFSVIMALLAREKDRQGALTIMGHLLTVFDQQPGAFIAYARLALEAGKLDVARTSVERALHLKPDAISAIILKASVRANQGEAEQAIADLKNAIQRYPKSLELRLSLGRNLIEMRRYEKAISEFEKVLKLAPADPDILYSIALLSKEVKRLDAAERYLKAVLATGKRKNQAYYFLARIEAERKRYTKAIKWYKKVKAGQYLLDAQLSIPTLMIRQGDLAGAKTRFKDLRARNSKLAVRTYIAESDALRETDRLQMSYQVLELGLEEEPDNTDLLYAHALAAERIGRIDVLERDLLQVIDKEPKYAHAWNALGYTLADRTDRLDEAMRYIKRALELSPDEPAILDSMGWVNYRMGNLTEALKYLRQANKKLKDPEVSAHLGEVLWVTGEEAEAKKVWERALNEQPDSRILQDAMDRFVK